MSQSHLFTFKENLSEPEQQELERAVNLINIPEVERYFKNATQNSSNQAELDQTQLAPIDHNRTNANATDNQRKLWRDTGLQKIKEGKVGVLLLAGGQGTRLGSSLPKGCLSVGSASGKCLFQIQFERIQRMQILSGGENMIPLYIMTSPATFEATNKALIENNFFGLEKTQVKIFNQGLLPCFNFDGQIYLKNKSSIATAPDGNGGLWKALRVNGIIDDMKNKNLESIHMYCVDNVLTKVANPEFLGFCLDKNADCAASCVEKTQPHEAVGVVCSYQNKARVVEYSEIDKSLAEMKDDKDDSKLAFRAGNICNHYFTVSFIEKVSSEEWEDKLVHHVAKKKIPTIDLKTGEAIKPETSNGIKLEKFVFDVFQFSENFALFNRERAEEFSPLKNNLQAKSDNARTASSHLHKLHHNWVLKNGGKFAKAEANQVADNLDYSVEGYPFAVEISPLTSYEGEGLKGLCEGKVFNLPLNL